MKKLERRAVICLLLALFLVAGSGVFTVRLGLEGGKWASYYANDHVFHQGLLTVGSVYDRNGVCLLKNTSEGPQYHEDYDIRVSNLHVTGDPGYNILTGANSAFRSKMIGYNFVTGTKGIFFGSGRRATLTVDARLNRAAYQALAGRSGLVAVYNWKTGEIVCLVSGPGFDPAGETGAAGAPAGAYINKAVSSVMTPGSIFKLVTSAAAIETVPALREWTFTCTSKHEVEGEFVTCYSAHGEQNFHEALANSCNCAFAELTLRMTPETMKKYTKKLGLTDSYDINGIASAAGSFQFETASINRAWAGIGQYEDQLNPISMMVYMGAIAGGGSAAEPVLLKGSKAGTANLIDSETAEELKEMMRNNVVSNYGDGNFPGLELHAKTGTAEVGEGRSPHGWFTGFSGDYAFIVCVENGGSGIGAAAPVANAVLQQLK